MESMGEQWACRIIRYLRGSHRPRERLLKSPNRSLNLVV